MSPPEKKRFVPRNPHNLTREELEFFMGLSDEEEILSGESDDEIDSGNSISDKEDNDLDLQGETNDEITPSFFPSTSNVSSTNPAEISDIEDQRLDHKGATNVVLSPLSISPSTSIQSQSLDDYISDISDSEFPSPQQVRATAWPVIMVLYR